MPSELTLVKPVALPTQSAVATIYESTNLADAFAVQLPFGTSSDPEVLWRFLISQQPSWIGWLTNARDAIVACFGLKTAKHLATLSSEANADRIGIFKVYAKSETEIVLGEDDKHLDFQTVGTPHPRLVSNARWPTDCLNRRPLPQPPGPSLHIGYRSFSSPGCESQSSSRRTYRLAQGSRKIEACQPQRQCRASRAATRHDLARPSETNVRCPPSPPVRTGAAGKRGASGARGWLVDFAFHHPVQRSLRRDALAMPDARTPGPRARNAPCH